MIKSLSSYATNRNVVNRYTEKYLATILLGKLTLLMRSQKKLKANSSIISTNYSHLGSLNSSTNSVRTVQSSRKNTLHPKSTIIKNRSKNLDKNATYPLGNEFADYQRKSVKIRCQFCHCNVQTEIKQEVGYGSYLACIGICAVGCLFGCCLVPFYCDDLKDVVHYCSNCEEVVGKATLF